MLKISAVVLPCVFLLTQGPAIAAGDDSKACKAPPPIEEWLLCIGMQRARAAPCTGSVEERLACLENKLIKQTDETLRLRLEMDRLTNPSVRPLDERRLSVQ